MKSIVAALLILLALSSSLYGQDRKNPEFRREFPENPLQKDERNRQNSDSLSRHFSDIYSRMWDSAGLFSEYLKDHSGAFGFNNGEEFPGSSRYYAKRRFPQFTYEKDFIKVPDTTNKYYLIIKDPVHHTVRK